MKTEEEASKTRCCATEDARPALADVSAKLERIDWIGTFTMSEYAIPVRGGRSS